MRAFVTGATGFVGAHLVQHLLDEGDDVAILVRPSSNPWRITSMLHEVTRIEGDLSIIDTVRGALGDWHPDVLFHLGWAGVHGNARNDFRSLRTNVDGSLSLIDLAADAGARAWIGLGSQAEFGPSGKPLTDDACTRPTTSYGASKNAVGSLSRHLCEGRGLRHAWLRLLSCYGPMDEPTYLIPYIISELLMRRSPVLSDGAQLHDTLYVSDVARALRLAATTADGPGACILGSSSPHTVRDIAERIRCLAAPDLALDFGQRPPNAVSISGSARRLSNMTGWSQTVTLDEGLEKTIEWHKRRPVTGAGPQ